MSSRNQIEEMTNIWGQKGKNINIWKSDRRTRMAIAWRTKMISGCRRNRQNRDGTVAV